MEEKILDYFLVPTGMAVMVAYHIWLLRRIVRHPTTTVVGINGINRRLWVRAMMADAGKNGVLAVQTLRNNIMASTLLASTSITLSSIIAVLMTGVGGRPTMDFVYGDKSRMGFSIKFFCLLVCFLLAFLFNVQSIRYYSHASILINVPISTTTADCKKIQHRVWTDYVAMTVNRGSYFWSLGLRTFYFSLPLFLWIFGPIPMFSSSLILVFMLYFLDMTLHFGAAVRDETDEHGFPIPIDDEESK